MDGHTFLGYHAWDGEWQACFRSLATQARSDARRGATTTTCAASNRDCISLGLAAPEGAPDKADASASNQASTRPATSSRQADKKQRDGANLEGPRSPTLRLQCDILNALLRRSQLIFASACTGLARVWRGLLSGLFKGRGRSRLRLNMGSQTSDLDHA